MPESVVPDPEFAPAADLAARRAAHAVESAVGLAEREAAALMAGSRMTTTAEIHAVVTVAFLKGYSQGYGDVLGRLDAIIETYREKAGLT